MKKIILPFAALSVMALSACDPTMAVNPTPGPKQMNGAVIGTLAGAAIGNQFGGGNGKIAATAGGAILGMFVGSSLGQQLDDLDRLKRAQASHQALTNAKSNTSVPWTNPDSGNSGTITPVKTYPSGGTYCREYQEKIIVGGQTQSAFGTACRQPDGQWKIVG